MSKFDYGREFFKEHNVNRGSVTRFLLMPEFKRSFAGFRENRSLFKSLVAGMLRDCGALPYNHPSRFNDGLSALSYKDLFGEAWFNMRRHGRGNVHQYGMFFALLMLIACGIMMLVTFISSMVVGAMVQTAAAQGAPDTGSLFTAPNPGTDIGLWLIKAVIGDASMGLGSPMSQALGDMLAIYSYAVLVVAAFVVAWAVLNIVVDTAHTGQFFGRRHNPVWYPIRLLFALGLLIPLNHGFNAGQYAVIQIAEWGSGLGSRAWSVYVDKLFGGENAEDLFASPTMMTQGGIVIDITRLLVCKHAMNEAMRASGHWHVNEGAGEVKMVTESRGGSNVYKFGIQAMMSPGGFRFEHDSQVCGTIVVPLQGAVQGESGAWGQPRASSRTSVRRDSHLRNGYQQIRAAFEMNGAVDAAVDSIRVANDASVRGLVFGMDMPARTFVRGYTPEQKEDYGQAYDIYADIESAASALDQHYSQIVDSAILQLNSTSRETVVRAVSDSGWVSAGLWMHHIVSMNHRLNSAVNEGAVVTPPQIRESFREGGCNKRNYARTALRHAPMGLGLLAQMGGVKDGCDDRTRLDDPNSTSGMHLMRALDILASYDMRIDASIAQSPEGSASATEYRPGTGTATSHHGNIAERIVRYLTEPVVGSSANLHPLAEMARIGSSLIDKAVAFLLIGWVLQTVGPIAMAIGTFMGVSLAGPLGAIMGFIGGSLLPTIGKIMVALAPLGLVAGLILVFLIPMLPFIRFMVAVLNWIISLVEAVLMMPLFALGHLRTDGEGLVGQMVGLYYLLAQLLFRPIVIVFGMITAFTLYETFVPVVNEFYYGATMAANYAGFLANLVSGIAYGVIYVFLMYILINACFKSMEILVNAIPKWLGGSSTGDQDESNQQGFIGAFVAMGAMGNVTKALQGSGKGGGGKPNMPKDPPAPGPKAGAG